MERVVRQPTYPRPTDSYYETRFRYLSQGDIFDDVPYTVLGPEIAIPDDTNGAALVPLLGVRAMLLTPTCDFRRPTAAQLDADRNVQPYTLETRVRVVQVLPMADIERTFESRTRSENVEKMRRYDTLRRYMYLPSLDGRFAESAVAIGPAWLIHLAILLRSDRLTQLTFAAARHLHYKIVLYETATRVDPESFLPSME